jgi:hypothetical protein
MALVVTFVTVTAIVILGVMLRRPESDKGWRDQAEGLRERMGAESISSPLIILSALSEE